MYRDALKQIRQHLRAGFEQKPFISLSDWADKYRYLPMESSAEPGRWRTKVTPYLKEIMDAATDPNTEEVTFLAPSQTAKTELILNTLFYFVHYDPCPVMVMQPTLAMAEAFSKDRVSASIRVMPVMRGLFKDPRSRDSGNTVLHKVFPGGHLTMTGANSASSLASRPIRVLINDEKDRNPPSAGTEGNPSEIAKKRTATFPNRLIVNVSSPTLAGASPIQKDWERGSRGRYHVPCPYCGAIQYMHFSLLRWDEGIKNIRYECEHCQQPITEDRKPWMLANGQWIHENPNNTTHRSFRISGLFSPFPKASWENIIIDFLRCKSDHEALKTWTNTTLGEVFDPKLEETDVTGLLARCESWDAVPSDVALITAGVDVQDNRIHVIVWGWGVDQAWCLDYKVIIGNPGHRFVWDELDEYLTDPWTNDRGQLLRVQSVCIDSAGHFTEQVYQFVKTRTARRVFAIIGRSGSRPAVSKPTHNNRHRVPLFTVGVDSIKATVFSQLAVKQSGPGYMHFPIGKCDEVFFNELTAEVYRQKMHKGKRPTWVWEQIRPRNEALDCTVYAMAAREIAGGNLKKLKAQLDQAAREEGVKEPKRKAPVNSTRQRPSWLRR